jgi:hypothetical protein
MLALCTKSRIIHPNKNTAKPSLLGDTQEGFLTMRTASVLLVLVAFAWGGKAFAFGVDVGPVHIHGTKVKVGDDMETKVNVTKIVRDEDEKDRVRRLEGHRKGDSEDKFKIKVVWADLDDDSKDVLKKVKSDTDYKVKLEKLV